MAKKTTNKASRRRRNRNRGGGGRTKIMYQLSNCGAVWDSNLSTADLKKAVDKIRMRMPPMNFNGAIDTDAEIMVQRLISEGCPGNDALEILDLLENTGRICFWFELPDFDGGAENKGERATAKAMGTLGQYDGAVKLRKSYAKSNASEHKKIAKWRGF
jgi:hypothetical protein